MRDLIKKILREEILNEKCWKGYTQKGMKTMFGKRYPNCVKKKKLKENVKEFNHEKNFDVNICDLDLEYVKKNYNEQLYGPFTEEGMSKKLSKCLCKNGKIIGCYLLNKQSMLESIKYIHYWVKEKTYKDLKWFVTKDELNKYKNKKGIFSKFLFIDEKYRNKNYGNILINYSKSLGDYNWGVSIKGYSDDYWVEKRNRIKICEWTEQDGSISVITTSKI